MEELFDTRALSLGHVRAITRGMYEVAKVDEVHATELILLREFTKRARKTPAGTRTSTKSLQQSLTGTRFAK